MKLLVLAHALHGCLWATVLPVLPLQHASPVQPEASLVASVRRSRPAADFDSAADLRRYALNALLVPLLDDDEPPNWTRLSLDHDCGPDTRVTVDGNPLAPGHKLPATPFRLRWDMDHCAQLGAIELSGVIELVVSPADAGFSAFVMPQQVRVDSWQGSTVLSEPFAAATSTNVGSRSMPPPSRVHFTKERP